MKHESPALAATSYSSVRCAHFPVHNMQDAQWRVPPDQHHSNKMQTVSPQCTMKCSGCHFWVRMWLWSQIRAVSAMSLCISHTRTHLMSFRKGSRWCYLLPEYVVSAFTVLCKSHTVKADAPSIWHNPPKKRLNNHMIWLQAVPNLTAQVQQTLQHHDQHLIWKCYSKVGWRLAQKPVQTIHTCSTWVASVSW